jgi:hypothetical protein
LIELPIVSFASLRLCVNSVPADAAPDGALKFLPDDFLQICRAYGADLKPRAEKSFDSGVIQTTLSL